MSLWRRSLAELLGTSLLVAAIVGSGIAAQRLSPHDQGLQLLENAIASVAVLGVVIATFMDISGSHINPVITIVQRLLGKISSGEAIVYIGAQATGAYLGSALANSMFAVAPFEMSTKPRSSPHLWLGEVVATFGLVLIVLVLGRAAESDRASRTRLPLAVAAWIAGAYFFTSSTSFANPAVTFGRMFSNTFAGIKPGAAPAFMVSQLLGALLAVGSLKIFAPSGARAPTELAALEEPAA